MLNTFRLGPSEPARFWRHAGDTQRPEGAKRYSFQAVGFPHLRVDRTRNPTTHSHCPETGPAENAGRKMDIGCEEMSVAAFVRLSALIRMETLRLISKERSPVSTRGFAPALDGRFWTTEPYISWALRASPGRS